MEEALERKKQAFSISVAVFECIEIVLLKKVRIEPQS